MGWWSKTVMGGDTPLDIEYNLYTLAGIKDDDLYEESKKEEINTKVREGVSKLIQWVKNPTDAYYARDGLAGQVLGVMVMRHGLPANEDTTKEAISLALVSAKEDEWATEGGDRLAYMSAFIEQLNNYDGTHQEPASEGLLEVMVNHLESGQSGLVNK